MLQYGYEDEECEGGRSGRGWNDIGIRGLLGAAAGTKGMEGEVRWGDWDASCSGVLGDVSRMGGDDEGWGGIGS